VLPKLPLVTLAVAMAACAILASAGWTGFLTYDRAAIADDELWRFVSGHLTHWNFDHLLWDVLAFVAAGAIIEGRSRRALSAALGLSALAISTTLWVWQPELASYRGLSGVDSALFTCAAVLLLDEARQHGNRRFAGAIGLALLGFLAKIGYELATGATLFVDSAAAGFTPLPLVHAVGGATGAIAAWTSNRTIAWRLPSMSLPPARARLCSTSAAKDGTPPLGT
jgi:rhomboid family GlyGly-CTERM serine protease